MNCQPGTISMLKPRLSLSESDGATPTRQKTMADTTPYRHPEANAVHYGRHQRLV